MRCAGVKIGIVMSRHVAMQFVHLHMDCFQEIAVRHWTLDVWLCLCSILSISLP